MSAEIRRLLDALEKIANASYTELRPVVERYRLDPDADSLLYPGQKGVHRSYATDEEWALARRVGEWYASIAQAALLAAPAVPQEEQEHTCRQTHSDGTKTTSSEPARKDDRAAATRRSKTPENARTAAATSGAAPSASAPGLLKSATDAAPAPAQEDEPPETPARGVDWTP
jgi:hypothetical protein